MARTEYFAYVISDYQPRVLHFTRHFSILAAEKHYGNLSKHYRGGSGSDYDLTILTREEMLETFSTEQYVIDWKERTITEKDGS